jgi:hypothetical protein
MSGKANLTPAQLLAGNQRHLVHGSYSLVQLGPALLNSPTRSPNLSQLGTPATDSQSVFSH